MASVFDGRTISYLDIKRMKGLNPEEQLLRDELMQALGKAGGGTAVNAKEVKWHIIMELTSRLNRESEWAVDELEGYIRWDEVVQAQLQKYWSSVTLSNGSVWWYRNEED